MQERRNSIANALELRLSCTNPFRGRGNGRTIVQNAILALSDKWLSLDEQIITAQMSFIHLRQVDIWFRTSADAMLLVRRMSASQITRQPLPLICLFF